MNIELDGFNRAHLMLMSRDSFARHPEKFLKRSSNPWAFEKISPQAPPSTSSTFDDLEPHKGDGALV